MTKQISPEPNLAKMIGLDFFGVGRWHFLLLICIFISAVSVVLMTHNTRQMTVQRENLLLEKDILDGEWRNLILEERAFAEHSRIQSHSVDVLDMERPAPNKEVIIKFK